MKKVTLSLALLSLSIALFSQTNKTSNTNIAANSIDLSKVGINRTIEVPKGVELRDGSKDNNIKFWLVNDDKTFSVVANNHPKFNTIDKVEANINGDYSMKTLIKKTDSYVIYSLNENTQYGFVFIYETPKDTFEFNDNSFDLKYTQTDCEKILSVLENILTPEDKLKLKSKGEADKNFKYLSVYKNNNVEVTATDTLNINDKELSLSVSFTDNDKLKKYDMIRISLVLNESAVNGNYFGPAYINIKKQTDGDFHDNKTENYILINPNGIGSFKYFDVNRYPCSGLKESNTITKTASNCKIVIKGYNYISRFDETLIKKENGDYGDVICTSRPFYLINKKVNKNN
ncbi:MAG TPA: hypothetical protein PKW80_05660 [Bacteroidales bacterium]|nr:hypothetical protein [Bacteroidales bacterium]